MVSSSDMCQMIHAINTNRPFEGQNGQFDNLTVSRIEKETRKHTHNEVIYDYGTGSLHHTRMSYDRDGNYFDIDMSSLEEGYSYAMKFVYKINDRYDEQSEIFKFRVD